METRTRKRLDKNYISAIVKTPRVREIVNPIKKQMNVLSLKPYNKNAFQLGSVNWYNCIEKKWHDLKLKLSKLEIPNVLHNSIMKKSSFLLKTFE